MDLRRVNFPDNNPVLRRLLEPKQYASIRYTERLAEAGIPYRRLPIDVAGHSPMMEPVLETLREHVEQTSRHDLRIPMVSTMTGAFTSSAEIGDPGYWGQHARRTVRFADAIGVLLEQRPGAFEHAQPMRQLRQRWDPVYDDLLAHLHQRLTGPRAIREFVRILSLHRCYPAEAVTEAVKQALACGSAQLDYVTLCLHQALMPESLPPQLDLSTQPALADVGQQPIDLTVYDQLLQGEPHVH